VQLLPDPLAAVTSTADGLSNDRTSSRSAIYLVLLSITAAYFLAFPIWRATFFVEIWPTESWNAYWQDAAASGATLYPDPASLVGNNYPPLSFYAVAFLGKLTGVDNLFAGRALSLLALVAIAVEVFAAVRLLAGGRLGAAIGALWYVAIMARNSTVYVGANDPQLAGLAIMGAALVYFLSLCRRDSSPIPALLLMVFAGFWKHNNLAIPLAAIVWLFIIRSRYAVWAAFVGAFAVICGLALCAVVYGPSFLPDLLANRAYGWSNVMGNIGHLQWSALALVLWGVWAWSDFRSRAAQFTALHIGLGLLACILQWLGHGVSGNAEFDLLLALGVGIGTAFTRVEASWFTRRIGADHCGDLIIAALLIRLVASDRQETALLLFSDDFRASLHVTEENTFREAESVAATAGDASCSIKLVCRLAGKPFVVDEFKTGELIENGKATEAEISEALAAYQIRAFSQARAGPSTSLSAWLRSRGWLK
jgi:hypothetical protein